MRWRTFLTALHVFGVVGAQSVSNSFFADAGTNAGFYTQINKKGLDLISEYLRERVTRFMTAGDVVFNVTTTLSPEVKIALLSQRLISFDEAAFTSSLSSQQGKGLLWTGRNVNLTVNTMFTIETSAGELVGSAPIQLEGSNVEFLLWTGVNSDGHLKTDLVTCKVSGGSVLLQLATSETSQLGEQFHLVQDYLNSNLDLFLCPTFHAELVPVISNRLLNTPLSAALFDQFFINYGLLGPVDFEADKILLKHRGNAFGILRQGRNRLNDFRLPFRAGPLDPMVNSGKMVDFIVGNYTLGSLMFWMDQYRKFDYEISKEAQNNSAINGYLKTDCASDDICAGTIFPALKDRYPGGLVIIKSHTISYPKLVMKQGKAVMYADNKIDAYVQQPDRTRRFMTADMSLEVVFDEPKFHDYNLKCNLKIDKFELSEVSSVVEGIDKNSLEFLVNALIELVLQEEVNKKFKGLSLPIVFDFEQHGVDVAFEPNRLRISSDFCYGSKCLIATAESKDDEVDYYDQVAG